MSETSIYHAPFEEGFSYHIYNRSVNQESIFSEESDVRFLLKKIKMLLIPFVEMEAYCIMKNHFHMLIRVKDINNISFKEVTTQYTRKANMFLGKKDIESYDWFLVDQFKRVLQSYAAKYNKDRRRSGGVFQKGFKRVRLKDEFRWFHILKYIHHNPIHHGFESRFDRWKYSSYSAFLSEKKTIIPRQKVLSKFDNNLDVAKSLFVKEHEEFKLQKGNKFFYIDY